MIRLRVLGSLELSDDEGRELRTVLVQSKRAALLAYLATASPSGFHRRDRLLGLFWPEQDDAHARDALNTAVRFLRREMGKAAIVNRGNDEIGVDTTVCWSDVADFRAALNAGRYEDALALYRGDLLDGFFTDGAATFDDWLDRTRAQMRADAARAARALADAREGERHFTMAIACARRALELSDGDERVLRELLEMLDRLGDRAGAVLAYDAFERRMASEFETEPAAETRALIARIRNRAPVGLALKPARIGAPLEPTWDAVRGWRVERELGRGGMATVYLARDPAHDRHVALKVMRPELVLSAGVERFLREIRITARLAHPHILPLIDSGARDGVPYLVTPYVAGESLRARLTRDGALPVSDALRIATEMAEALDYAHRSGIVHCDVKPENILLADGHALVADFGIARALVASGASSASMGEPLVGSRRYMSPEQATDGADIDARTDLYSLGCVLLEMLSGQVPADDEGGRARLATLTHVSAGVRRMVSECMALERESRPASAADVLRRLEELRTGGAPTPHVPARPRRVMLATASGVVLATVAIAFSIVPRMRHDWSSAALGAARQLTNAAGLELDPAISPDGTFIAYAGGTAERMRIYVRPASGGDAVEVSDASMRQHRWPTWSPDGSQLAFLASDGDRGASNGKLFIVSALGGARRLLGEGLAYHATPSWSPDGRFIAYPKDDSLRIRDVQGVGVRTIPVRPHFRSPRALSLSGSVWAMHSIAWSPDGHRFAFVAGNAAFALGSTAFGNMGPNAIWTISLDGTPPVRVSKGPYTFASPVWTPDGRGLLYASNAGGALDVYHQAIHGDGRANGEPRRLTTGLSANGISMSRDGSRLAYSLLNYRSNIFAAPIATSGTSSAAALRAVTDENQTIETVDVTADGTSLVFESNRNGRSHIYRMPAAGGAPVQLTDGPEEDFAPKWSPDGKRIAFMRREPAKDFLRDVYVMSADGGDQTRISLDRLDDSYPAWASGGTRLTFGQIPTGSMASLLGSDGRWSVPVRDTLRGKWTLDGRYRVFTTGGDLWAQRVGGTPSRLASGKRMGGQIMTTALNPDGTLVYFRLIENTGVHSFHSVRLAGGAPKLVLRLDDSARRPSRIIFSASKGHLYFSLTNAESDIWVVELRR